MPRCGTDMLSRTRMHDPNSRMQRNDGSSQGRMPFTTLSMMVPFDVTGMVRPLHMTRPQVGIERLPARRMINEPREAMNCKSCRKRKIKCNRLRPSCEACQVFQCPCIYDAVPKKRGPKRHVLDAQLQRADGPGANSKENMDQQATWTLDQDTSSSPTITSTSLPATSVILGESPSSTAQSNGGYIIEAKPRFFESVGVTPRTTGTASESAIQTPSPVGDPSSPTVHPDALTDSYFSRFHAKPFFILDESSIRQRLRLNMVPSFLVHAMYAVAARYTPHPNGYLAAVKLSEDFATRARREIDLDEVSIDSLQACLLLVIAFIAAGKANAIGMTLAQDLHRELDTRAVVTTVERETRTRLFWTCYLLDRFTTCGSKRPCLIADKPTLLRVPCWSPSRAALSIDGEFLHCATSNYYLQRTGRKSQGSCGLLIEISRILGVTTQYLAAGGVKGDSQFPWHKLSNLSKIRHDLDIWASETEDVFLTMETLFGQHDSTVLVLSKLIYHLIHCLIYRPFLPIDLAELAGNGVHQSWQIDATNLCFLHANAIAELVELGKQKENIEWPEFVGYCLCTAGSIHIHGAHYSRNGPPGEMCVFSSSTEFLNREIQQLSDLRYAWASVQHQRDTLEAISKAHSELINSLGNLDCPPVLHLEDFFDRYSNIGGPGGPSFSFDTANVSLNDVVVNPARDADSGHDLYVARIDQCMERKSHKRKNGAQGGRRHCKILATVASDPKTVIHIGLPMPSRPQTPGFPTITMPTHQPYSSPDMRHSQASLDPYHKLPELGANDLPESAVDMAKKSTVAAAATAGFTIPSYQCPPTQVQHPFSPLYTSCGHNNTPSSTLGPSVCGPSSLPPQAATKHSTSGITTNSYNDPVFGGVPTIAISNPASWHRENDNSSTPRPSAQVAAAAVAETHPGGPADAGVPLQQPLAPSSGGLSTHGSTGTMAGDEKDPFLAVLEQLADSECVWGPGSESDFFFAGPSM